MHINANHSENNPIYNKDLFKIHGKKLEGSDESLPGPCGISNLFMYIHLLPASVTISPNDQSQIINLINVMVPTIYAFLNQPGYSSVLKGFETAYYDLFNSSGFYTGIAQFYDLSNQVSNIAIAQGNTPLYDTNPQNAALVSLIVNMVDANLSYDSAAYNAVNYLSKTLTDYLKGVYSDNSNIIATFNNLEAVLDNIPSDGNTTLIQNEVASLCSTVKKQIIDL